MAADHFQPWVPQQGQASYVWNVLSAVGQRTTGDLGPGVTCPIVSAPPGDGRAGRGTLEAMYPDRTWLGLGSGEALNEHVFGGYWPEAPERIRMMFEAVELIQKLFTGKDVKHAGEFFKLHSDPALDDAASSRRRSWSRRPGRITAKRTGARCDGIITPGATTEKVAGVLAKFDEGAVSAGKDPSTMPKLLQLHLSWAPTDEEALANAMTEWPNGGMKFAKQDVRSPHRLRRRWRRWCGPRTSRGGWSSRPTPTRTAREIQRFLDLGITQIYLHNVGRNQAEWLEVFGRDVLPKLHRMTIHDGHPFATPESERDPVRRLRGRLGGAVSLWTAGVGTGPSRPHRVVIPAVAPGEPAHVLGAGRRGVRARTSACSRPGPPSSNCWSGRSASWPTLSRGSSRHRAGHFGSARSRAGGSTPTGDRCSARRRPGSAPGC